MHTRNGSTAANFDTTSAADNPEVLPRYDAPDPRIRIGAVECTRATTLQSPCFWVIVGALAMFGAGAIIVYVMNEREN